MPATNPAPVPSLRQRKCRITSGANPNRLSGLQNDRHPEPAEGPLTSRFSSPVAAEKGQRSLRLPSPPTALTSFRLASLAQDDQSNGRAFPESGARQENEPISQQPLIRRGLQ